MYLRRLKDLREDAEKTQNEIAQILGCSLRAYWNYENGVSEISLQHLLILLQFYKTDADYLLNFSKSREECIAMSYHWQPKRLMFLRREQHKSQKEFAELLNTDESTYRKYESGTRLPPLSIIVKLAQLLKTSPNSVLGLRFHYKQ